jgi:hypothetical protein
MIFDCGDQRSSDAASTGGWIHGKSVNLTQHVPSRQFR